MNRLNKKLTLLMLIVLIISNFTIAYGATEFKSDEIEENAKKLGYQEGIIKAYENNSKDIDEPYYIAIPKDDKIKENYKKAYDSFDKVYERLILDAYREGFKIGYNEIIKNGKSDDIKVEKIDYADILGTTIGEIYGHRDYYNKNKNNWNKARPSDKKIFEMYNLNQETSDYKYAFLRTFREEFKEGYHEGYRKANLEPIRISYEEGIKDGEYFGKVLGTTCGAKDFFDNKTNDYKRNIPSDSTIQIEYSLNYDDQQYKEGFTVGFRRSYEESYNEAFRIMNANEHKRSYEEGYTHGKDSGVKKGEVSAIKDYHLKLKNDWKKHEPTQIELIREYNLILESEKYRDGFISGFKEGLSEGYTKTFQNLNKEVSQHKTKVETVSIAGGEVVSLDKVLILKINRGTYYNPVVVSIDMLSDNSGAVGKDFIKASDYYSINIVNKSDETNNKEDIELKFEYYGKHDGGIYKHVNGNWIYVPSYIEDGFIKTKIKPNSFKEKEDIYCVLVDKNAILPLDIRGHWAKDEITSYLRRGIVAGYSDKTFKPDKSVTRGEFLIILNKVYGLQLTSDIENTNKRHKPITYKEIENIMRKVTTNDKFHWYNVSTKMLYEKDYRSKSYNNMNNNITRAETVYMLYLLNQWKY